MWGREERKDADLVESLFGVRPADSPAMSRADHLAWAKERALEYCDAGDPTNAWASMVSDLGKHPNLADHEGIKLGMLLAMGGFLGTVEEVRKHIEGFN